MTTGAKLNLITSLLFLFVFSACSNLSQSTKTQLDPPTSNIISTPKMPAQQTNNIVIPLTSSDNTCKSLDTHIYCISSDLPAPTGPLPWGEISSYSPEVFCASDLSNEICGWVTSALLTAVIEWGNYGPLEYWVLGIDTDAANAVTRRAAEAEAKVASDANKASGKQKLKNLGLNDAEIKSLIGV